MFSIKNKIKDAFEIPFNGFQDYYELYNFIDYYSILSYVLDNTEHKCVKIKFHNTFDNIDTNQICFDEVKLNKFDIIEDLKINDSSDFKIIKCSEDVCAFLNSNSLIIDKTYNYKIILKEVSRKIKIEANVYLLQ